MVFYQGDYAPSRTYAAYTRNACEDLGVSYELREVGRLSLEKAIMEANRDPLVHGIMVYYPIFGNEQDHYIKELVDFRKDIEGLHSFWINKLYRNDRLDEQNGQPVKAVVPCTSLAIIKMLEANGAYGSSGSKPAANRTVAIFNRSEVVGRPLAVMMSNDGALVYSFDESGPLLYRRGQAEETDITRGEALQASNIVITGVPSRNLPGSRRWRSSHRRSA
ncbi:MAG: bifunctional methylenetetrahydrofolate dehydrogenase/methenyltetrahydrofolate cyclohydrolase [Syntrophotaleaceae bacterium]